jgi:hypothetical protein
MATSPLIKRGSSSQGYGPHVKSYPDVPVDSDSDENEVRPQFSHVDNPPPKRKRVMFMV